ncbi:alpha/beta fold hydrolase [soil metagenome]
MAIKDKTKKAVTSLKAKAPAPVQKLREKAAAMRRKTQVADGPPVILVHGLNVPRMVMAPMQWRLRRTYGRRVINADYQWWFDDVPKLAQHLSQRVATYELKEFDAVTHSMGGIVLRYAMNHFPMPKLRRAVLIGAPNAGCWLADHLEKKWGTFLYSLCFGQPGMQMRSGDNGIAAHAGLLHGSEVGVIAGGSGSPKGKRNWFNHPGDTDGTVAVEETIIPGMKDFVLLNCDHTRLLFNSQTFHMANLFLEHGVFRPRLKKQEDHDEHD